MKRIPCNAWGLRLDPEDQTIQLLGLGLPVQLGQVRGPPGPGMSGVRGGGLVRIKTGTGGLDNRFFLGFYTIDIDWWFGDWLAPSCFVMNSGIMVDS